MQKILKSFCNVIIPYKGKSAKPLRNAFGNSIRNSCQKIVYNKFQVYSLQM